MACRTSSQRKRLSYVAINCQNPDKEKDFVSSDDDIYMLPGKKVRRKFSVSVLRKNSEHFEIGEDHLYSKLRNSEEFKERKFDSSRLGCVKSSSTLPESQAEDANECKRERNPEKVVLKKRVKCSSKNAIMARVNRMKKKQYMLSLENANKELHEQNAELQQNFKEQQKTIGTLQHEIMYLKSLLANSKEISDLLKNLKTSTGLPVTSSLQSAVTENISNEISHTPTLRTEKSNNNRQAQVKKVTTGSNFPILQDDVNLGDYSLRDGNQDEFVCNMSEESYFSFSVESDLSFDGILFNENYFDISSSMFNDLVDKGSEPEVANIKEEAMPRTLNLNEIESDVGLCLHINKRKISVELCSVCNTKAQTQETN